MLNGILIALFLGLLSGIITGLIPGIHINLIGIFLISLTQKIFYKINSIYLIVFITSTAITHTFIDFIPSIFLGCPDTDTELSVLPGHQMLKSGKGYEAIMLTAFGSISAIFILLILLIPSIIIIPKISNFIIQLIPFLLIFIIIFLIFLEKNKINALIVIIITGILGYIVLNLNILNQPLLPLLTGLFGSSMLLISIKSKIKIPKQEIKTTKTKLIRPLIGSLIASPLCCFLPGLGSGQAAIIGNTISRIKKSDKKSFMVLLGATNTLVMAFSFIALYLISRTRTGAAVAIKELIGKPSLNQLILIIFIIIISGIISFFLVKKLAKFFSSKINSLNYTKLSIIILIILIFIIILISNFIGFLVFIISTITGIYCISLKVRRTNMMGCLMIPTIIFYLF